MADAQVLIGRITLTTNQAIVHFSNIPQTYRDLIVVINAGGTVVSSLQFTLNGDTGSNYSRITFVGNGSTATSTSGTTPNYGFAGDLGTSVTALSFINIMDYSATDKHKVSLARGNQAGDNVNARAVRWASTSAVNSVSISADTSASLIAGSTFTLYGVLG